MRMHNENANLLTAVALGSSQQTEVRPINEALAYAIQFEWTGGTGIGGDLVVEASNNKTTFVPLDTYTITGETSGARLVNVERAGYAYVRASWVYAAGSGGTMTISLSSKRN